MDKSRTDNAENILSQALMLFSARGYEAVGVQELCDASGITKPTLYYYFGNKEGLLRALIAKYSGPFHETLKQASHYEANPRQYEKDVFPTLQNLANSFFNFANQNEAYYRLHLSFVFSPQESTPNTLIREINVKQYKIIEEVFQKISAVHKNMKGKERRYSITFIGMLNSFITLVFNGYETFSERKTNELIKQFMHGIFV